MGWRSLNRGPYGRDSTGSRRMRQTIPDVLTVVRIKELFFAEASRGAWACRRFGTKRAFAGQMLFGRLLVCSVGILRREAVARVNGFDPDIQLMENADF
jgi:hypothetical protein